MFGSRPVTTDLRAQQQQTEQRKQLLQCVTAETQVINQFTASLAQKENLDNKECLAVIEETIAAIERVMKGGDWESSLFLRNTIKPVKALHEKLLQLQQSLTGDKQVRVTAPSIAAGMVPVFISLFQAEGINFTKWAMQVRALANYVQGRPIYRNEADVQRLVFSKLDTNPEAYVVVAIKPEMILSQETARIDRNGCELLTLVDRAVCNENIIEFVHQDKRYCFIDNKLVLQG